jgi:hypothetical protein
MVLIGCSNLQKREELNQQTKVEMQKFIIGKWEGIYESYYTFNNERLNIEVLKFLKILMKKVIVELENLNIILQTKIQS